MFLMEIEEDVKYWPENGGFEGRLLVA